MSSNTSWGRVNSGYQAENYTLRRAIDPLSTLRDLRQFTGGSRRQRAAAIQGTGGGAASPLGNLADASTAAIQNASRRKQQQQGNQQQQQNQHANRKQRLDGTEQARQAMQDSTLTAHTDQAASQASEPAVRYGVLGNDGEPAMSTRDTRDTKTMAATGQPLDDDGPLGSFGAGGFLGRLPTTFDSVGGMF